MADEVRQKRPVPPQFLKKKKPVEVVENQQLPDPPNEIHVPVEVLQSKEVDVQGLTRDLMFNKYFHILEREARPIAERMLKDGADSLNEVKWFLSPAERRQLAKELKEKYGLV